MDISAKEIKFSSSAISVLFNAELSVDEEEKSSLIHMDADHSLLPLPSPVKAAIFESFSRQNLTDSEVDVTPAIKQFIKNNYGFPVDSSSEFIYADCSQALLKKLILCCVEEGGTFCFPEGSNGNLVTAANFFNANVKAIPTRLEDGYKLRELALSDVLRHAPKPWLFISGPTVSPTGRVYSNEEMEMILTTCAKFGARVVIDTSFSGLDFNKGGSCGWNINSCLSKLNISKDSRFCVCLLGGLSLSMLSGALKFGFLVLNQPPIIDAFHSSSSLCKPHSTIKYAIRKLLGLMEQKSGELLNATAEQTKTLETRSKCLKEVTLDNYINTPFL